MPDKQYSLCEDGYYVLTNVSGEQVAEYLTLRASSESLEKWRVILDNKTYKVEPFGFGLRGKFCIVAVEGIKQHASE